MDALAVIITENHVKIIAGGRSIATVKTTKPFRYAMTLLREMALDNEIEQITEPQPWDGKDFKHESNKNLDM